MSYQAQDQLTNDVTFSGRVRSCCVQQAETFKDDARPAWVAVANACLQGDGLITNAFIRIEAGGPGIADKADNGDGTIDQAKITDADLLSLTQANWPVVAGLYFNEDGTPIGGTP
jgi:hypothetical protein